MKTRVVLSVRMKDNVFRSLFDWTFHTHRQMFLSFCAERFEGRLGIFIFPPFRLSGMVSHVKGVAGDTSTDKKWILRLYIMPEC